MLTDAQSQVCFEDYMSRGHVVLGLAVQGTDEWEDIWSYDVGADRFECSGGRPSFTERVEDLGFGDLLKAGLGRGRSHASA